MNVGSDAAAAAAARRLEQQLFYKQKVSEKQSKNEKNDESDEISYLFISARSKTRELRLNSSSPDLSPSGTEIFFVFEAARMLQARIDNHNTYKNLKILSKFTGL